MLKSPAQITVFLKFKRIWLSNHFRYWSAAGYKEDGVQWHTTQPTLHVWTEWKLLKPEFRIYNSGGGKIIHSCNHHTNGFCFSTCIIILHSDFRDVEGNFQETFQSSKKILICNKTEKKHWIQDDSWSCKFTDQFLTEKVIRKKRFIQ